jgi:hypothetical protein
MSDLFYEEDLAIHKARVRASDHANEMIRELATWNGRLSMTIELALLDFKYNRLDRAIERLRAISDEYTAERDAAIAKLAAPRGE